MTEPASTERSIFLEAIEKHSEAERALYVQQACLGNSQLCDKVNALLRAHQESGDLLDAPDAFSQTIDPPITEHPGTQIGDYKLHEKIGEGGMGIVYAAEQTSLSRRVALKILPSASLWSENALERFRQEVRITATLEHPNILPIYEMGYERSVHFYAMKLVDGCSLAEVITHRKQEAAKQASDANDASASAETVVAAVTQAVVGQETWYRAVAKLGKVAATTLAFAHKRGVIHRDIKPSNLLLDRDGKLFIADFGLARFEAEIDVNMTRTGDLMGTPRFMSPEQASGRSSKKLTSSTDIFSLGSTLYELLTLKPVITATAPAPAIRELQTLRPIPLRTHDPNIPLPLERIVLKCLQLDPIDRYSGADELAKDLDRFLEGLPVLARQPGLVRRTSRWIQRRPQRTLSVIAGLCLSLIVLATGFWIVQRQSGDSWLRGPPSEDLVDSSTTSHLSSDFKSPEESPEMLRSTRNNRNNQNRIRRSMQLETLENRSLLASVPVPANLVSWWTGNDTAADKMGVHNGTLVGGASYAPGKVGQGFSLDGINDTVTLAGTFGGGPEATLEAWVKTTGTNRDVQAIISATEDQFVHLQLSTWQSNDAYAVGGTFARLPAILQTPTDTWRHIAFTIKSGDSRLYVDGGLVGTSTLTFTSLLTTSTFRIGSGRGGGRFFQGGIDEVSYYSRALNAGEIQGIYNAGSDGKVFSPIAIDAPSVIEGSTGTTTPVTFTLTRTDTSVPLTVDWTTADNTATAGLDYVAASGSVTFAIGQSTTTVQVTVNGDNSPEINETLKLILTPVGQSPVMGLATILEDDVGVSVSDATATEGDVRIGQSLGAFVSKSNNGGLDLATGMAWGPDGNLYVGSLGSNKVLQFDGTTGALMGTFISNADSPAVQGLSFRPASPEAPDGTLYVLSRDTAQVQRYNAKTGAPLGVFITPGSGGLSTAKGMTFGPDGNWYISSFTNQVLRYRGTDGAFMGVFVSAGSGGLNAPRGLTFGPDGNLYVASFSHAVLRYNGQSGAFMNAFIPAESGGLQSPGEILFRNGSLYVSSQWTQEVLRYDSQTGAFLDKAATFCGSSALGLLLDSHNNLLVGGLNEIFLFGPQSQASFTVRLNIPSATPVTVDYTTASGSATAGSDFTSVSGSVTFAPGQTTQSIIVPTTDDTLVEGTESFALSLSNPVGGTIILGQATGTITDDDSTKFYVVDDGSTDRTYRYSVPGNTLVTSTMASGNTAPRGAASTAAGTTVWVVDANKTVYVYNAAGAIQGSWAAGGLTQPEGIAVWGNDVWIVDAGSDYVYKFPGAASKLSGTQNAALIGGGSFKLDVTTVKGKPYGNTNGKGIVTDGASLWVVDDGSSDKVYKYSVSGAAIGNWTMNGGGGSPTGITLNPASPSSLWIVDNASDKVYEYTAAVSAKAGSLIASAAFALAAGNTNPQDIADPPMGDSQPIVSTVMAPMMASKAIESALTQLSDDFVRSRVGSTLEIDRSNREQSLATPLSTNSLVQFPTQQSMQPSMSENRASSQSKRLTGTTDDIFSNWNLDELKEFDM